MIITPCHADDAASPVHYALMVAMPMAHTPMPAVYISHAQTAVTNIAA